VAIVARATIDRPTPSGISTRVEIARRTSSAAGGGRVRRDRLTNIVMSRGWSWKWIATRVAIAAVEGGE
jgi:hypothetical protein